MAHEEHGILQDMGLKAAALSESVKESVFAALNSPLSVTISPFTQDVQPQVPLALEFSCLCEKSLKYFGVGGLVPVDFFLMT